jgi:8-hydroxy-5-deazaflavin:NADPH oxidoreductase
MQITIFGTGNIGGGLGAKWAAQGHSIIYGVRDPNDPKHAEILQPNLTVKSLDKAAEGSEVVVLAVPFNAVEQVIKLSNGLRKQILIDCTNAISSPLPEGVNSAAEAIARWTDNPRVVKAFNSTGSANLRNPIYNGQNIDTLICGNDEDAKKVVRQLAEAVGFNVIDAGELAAAPLLESFAKLWITLAYKRGYGPDIAFKLLTR